jgi:hypothetical protein
MANVLLLSSAPPHPFDPWKHGTHFLLKHGSEIDTFGAHRVVDAPEEADLILFAEMGEAGAFAERVRAHPYYRRFRAKCFLFDSGDTSYPLLPGLYASLTRQNFRSDHCRTGFYLYLVANPFIGYRPPTGREKYLASFIGSRQTHALRAELYRFNRPDILVLDISSLRNRITYHGEADERAGFWSSYADAMMESKFSLCPRGRCPNSIRLYESMQMGRPCVIISDDWQPNEGVDWDSCSIRVAESDVARVPEILEQAADRAVEMGLRARAEWEKLFAPQVVFHHVVEQCLAIQRERGKAGPLERMYHHRHILQHPRMYLSSKANLYRNHQKIYW